MFVVLGVVFTLVRFVGDLARRTARSQVSVVNDVHRSQNSVQLFSSEKQSCHRYLNSSNVFTSASCGRFSSDSSSIPSSDIDGSLLRGVMVRGGSGGRG